MIIKFFELNKINLNLPNLYLLYGKNEGAKKETILKITSEKKGIEIIKYDEREVLIDNSNFEENILSKSLFENEKIFIIKRTTDKIIKVLERIKNKNLEDITIIFESENLEKKSKLRTFFEKDKNFVCIPFYPDNNQTLLKLTYEFLQKNNLTISTSNINLIVNKLKKLELYAKNGKKIDEESIIKLTNLLENYSISELVDNCLAKNQKKTISILNENNFNNEDCIIISRIFLSKAKKILYLSETFEENKNVDLTISTSKPPIFWKDKEITKKQILEWKPNKIKKLIYNLNEIELLIKKNINNSLNIVTDFILEQCSSKTNN